MRIKVSCPYCEVVYDLEDLGSWNRDTLEDFECEECGLCATLKITIQAELIAE